MISKTSSELVVTSNGDTSIVTNVGSFKDGSSVVVWSEFGKILARIYNADGTAQDDSFFVTKVDSFFVINGDSSRPDVAVLEDDSFVVGYTVGAPGGTTSLRAQRYSSEGEELGAAFSLFSNPDHWSVMPRLAALEGGSFVSTFTVWSLDGSRYGVYAQRHWPNGTQRDEPFLVNQTTSGYQSFGDVVGLSGGRFAIVWRSQDVDSSFYAAMLRIYGADGQPVTDEIQMNQTTFGSQTTPVVTELNDGRIAVAWASDGQDGSDYGVVQRLFDANGVALGDESVVNTQRIDAQNGNSITSLENGGYVVAWVDGFDNEIWGAAFDQDGNRVAADFQFSSGGDDFDTLPELAATGADSFTSIWLSYEEDAEDIAVEMAWFEITADLSPQSSDLNANGYADILFFNATNNTVGQIEMESGTWSIRGQTGANWNAVGTGFFDADGIGDVLWHNPITGAVGRFDYDARGTKSWDVIGKAGLDWEIAGIGDINGDGQDDILWANAGKVGVFAMDSDGNPTWQSLGATGADWSLVATGDLNGDGIDDILWENKNGALGQFRMSDAGYDWVGLPRLGRDWTAVETGDFDGDGTDDILVFNETSGAWGQFNMADGTPSWLSMGQGAAGWTISGTGDFNADGRDDILWRNETSGRIGQHEMNGGDYAWSIIADASPAWDVFL